MPTYLDFSLLGMILASALIGALLGLTRQTLMTVSWIAAAAAGDYFYSYLQPNLAQKPSALIASSTAVFLVVLILALLVAIRILDATLDSRLGALDRPLGLLFGAAWGFVHFVVAFVFFSVLSPTEKQPEWVRNAWARPLLQSVGDDLTAMLPHDLLSELMKSVGMPAGEPRSESGPVDKPDAGQNSPTPLLPKRQP